MLKGVDLGVTDADRVSLRNGLHLFVVCCDACSLTHIVVTHFFGNCLQPCAVSVQTVLLTPNTSSDQWDHRRTTTELFAI